MAINQAYATVKPKNGMIPRKGETMRAGTKLARVGHSLCKGKPLSHINNLSSPWWLSEGTLEYLWGIAKKTQVSLSTVVRQKCCIPFYWDSSCDLIYEITLNSTTACWIGPGTFFFPERGEKNEHVDSHASLWPENDVVFFPAGEFPQIFIPGIWDVEIQKSMISNPKVVSVATLDSARSYFGENRIKL